MDSAAAWQQLFESWPKTRPRVGVVVTRFQESIGFTQFLVGEGILALERERPDTIGARKVLLSFAAIEGLKLADTDDFQTIKPLGFH